MDHSTDPLALEQLYSFGVRNGESLPSLDLVNDANKVADNLLSLNREMEVIIAFGQFLKSVDFDQFKEDENHFESIEKSIDLSEEVEVSVKSNINYLKHALKSAKDDANLNNHLEELVVSSFNSIIESFVTYYNLLVELRWKAMEYLADQEESTGEAFTSVDALFKRLQA